VLSVSYDMFLDMFVIEVYYSSESDAASQGLYDKTSLRTMLAVVDYLRHQQRPLEADRFVIVIKYVSDVQGFCIFPFGPALTLIRVFFHVN